MSHRKKSLARVMLLLLTEASRRRSAYHTAEGQGPDIQECRLCEARSSMVLHDARFT